MKKKTKKKSKTKKKVSKRSKNKRNVNKRSKNIYRKKPYLKNLFLLGYSFGVGFFFSGIYWVSYSLTFFDEFKYW